MPRTFLLAALAVLPACGGAAPAPTPTPSNQSGGVGSLTPAADGSLAGPFARLEDAPEIDAGESPVEIRLLASAPGQVTVALREVRSTPAAASCMVTLQTASGFYVGEGFLCSADRSDEIVNTDQVGIVLDGEVATITFRNSYERIGTAPFVETYSITCTLEPTLSCT